MYSDVRSGLPSTGTRTQDLIFTLYGDYLIHRGGRAWIGALIELLGTLGTSEQAVRSTASRMARKGWLTTERQGRNSYYSLTPRAATLLSKGDQQIFYPSNVDWDGCWYLVTYTFSGDLDHKRHELRKRLTWLGFGWLGNSTWISPRDRQEELQSILDELDIGSFVDYFRAEYLLPGQNISLVRRCWDLDQLNQDYQRFTDHYRPLFERDLDQVQNGELLDPEHAFQQRFWLVHEYRYFPFRDPYLPDELLPAGWSGHQAIHLFRSFHELLRDRANSYVAGVIDQTPWRDEDLQAVDGLLSASRPFEEHTIGR